MNYRDWSDWASTKDYGMDDIYVTSNEAEALEIAHRIDGVAVKCKEGFVINNRFGGMVNRYDYFADIDAVHKSLL